MASMILKASPLNVALTCLLRLTMVSGQLLGSSTRRFEFSRSLSALKGLKCLLSEDELEENKETLGNGNGIDVISSEPPRICEPPGLGSCLSFSIGIGLNNDEPRTSIDIDLDDDDGIFETSSEPPGLSWLFWLRSFLASVRCKSHIVMERALNPI
jgi:hypothetical protein